MGNSLFTGVSGLRVHQEMLDVVGNNLANANTVGYKSQRIIFADLVYQTLAEPTGARSDAVSGTNPVQLGLGVKVASVDSNLRQGGLESTGRDLDFAIEGNGYFVVKNAAGQQVYTRAGAFDIDANNFLVDPATGARIQRFGSVGEPNGTNPAFQTPGSLDIRIPQAERIAGKATSSVTMQGNLDAAAAGPIAQVLNSAQPLRSGGNPVTLTTLLNDLDDNTADYGGTDQLQLQGTTAGNVPVSASLAVGATTTVGDLINAINTNFPGSTASLDANGNIVVTATTAGTSNLSVGISDASGNTGASAWANHTQLVTTAGRNGSTVQAALEVFDTQGTPHSITLTFQKQADNVWDLTASMSSTQGVLVDNTIKGITFNEDGSFRNIAGPPAGDGTITAQFRGLASTQVINLDLGAAGGFKGLTQMGGDSSAAAVGQDGYGPGSLTAVTVDQDGTVNGTFSNGRSLTIAQMAIATFANPGALSRLGDNYFSENTASGTAQIGVGGDGGRGLVQQRVLESSNVDIALEFTKLITAQRGFQINAKTITTSDEMLQDLAQIIR